MHKNEHLKNKSRTYTYATLLLYAVPQFFFCKLAESVRYSILSRSLCEWWTIADYKAAKAQLLMQCVHWLS